jgi:hypothetical protein
MNPELGAVFAGMFVATALHIAPALLALPWVM